MPGMRTMPQAAAKARSRVVYRVNGERVFPFRKPPELPEYPRHRRRPRLTLIHLVDIPNRPENFAMKNHVLAQHARTATVALLAVAFAAVAFQISPSAN